MTVSKSVIEDRLCDALEIDIDVERSSVGLKVGMIELATVTEIAKMVELCERTWRDVDRAGMTKSLQDKNGRSCTFAACYNEKGTMVACASYGLIGETRHLLVDLLATSQHEPHAVFALADYFKQRIERNNFRGFEITPQKEIRRDRRSRCTVDAGLSAGAIEHKIAAMQSIHLGASVMSYSASAAGQPHHRQMVALHNSVWEDDPLQETHMENTGIERSSKGIIVIAKDGSIVAGAVMRANRAQGTLDVPVSFVDPWHPGALRTLALTLETFRDNRNLHGVQLRRRTLLNQRQRDEYSELVQSMKVCAETVARGGGHGEAIAHCAESMQSLQMTSVYGSRVKKLWEFLFVIPIEDEQTRQTIVRRMQRLMKIILSIETLARESNQNIFLTESQMESLSGIRATLIEDPLKRTTVDAFTDRVPKSMQHLVRMPQGSHVLAVDPYGSSGAVAIMTPPDTTTGKEFTLHCFLPRPSKRGEQRAGGAIVACELLDLFLQKQPYKNYLVHAYPMEVDNVLPDDFEWQKGMSK